MAIMLVQGNARGASDTTPISVTMASTPIEGNLLIAVIGLDSYPNNPAVTSIVQTGVTWTYGYLGGSNGVTVEIWYGVIGAGASTGITINFTASQAYGFIANVCEWSGLAASSPIDQTASDGFGSNFVTGTTPTTTQADELCVGGIVAGSSQSSPTNSFTMLDGTIVQHNIYQSYLYRIVSSTGTYGCGVTAGGWSSGAIATFKAASGTPSPTVKKGGSLPNTMTQLLTNGTFFSASKRFPKFTPRVVI